MERSQVFVAQPGLIVGNRYTLTQVIGRGGMGEVWKAHDRDLDSPCAVKFILQHLASDRGIRERFTREAKAVARLRSPHVVHILGVGEIEHIPYLAMELLDGETLLSRLDRIGRLHPVVTLKMVEQVAEALESAHQAGIVHRDLKPDNIWFWSGHKVFIKVLDFGVAKTGMTTESLQTATGALVGTPQYMSPEQALGNRDIDHRSDLWSLAVITIECLTGKRPFESSGLGDLLLKIVGASPPSLRALAPELPVSLQDWWVRALARDPRDRYQSATELVEALRPHLVQLEAEWVAPHGVDSVRSVRSSYTEDAFPSAHALNTPPVLLHDSSAVQSVPVSVPASGAHAASGHVPHSGQVVSGRHGLSRDHEVRDQLEVSGHHRALEAARGALGPDVASGGSPRSPGSLGPISSGSQPSPLRRSGRQRTLFIAAGLLAAALLVTATRLFTSTPEAGKTASVTSPTATPEASTVARGNTQPEAAGTPAPNTPVADPAATPGSGPSDVQIRPVAGHQLDQGSPWDPALRGNKPPESTTTVVQALQPRATGAPSGASPAAAEAAAGLGEAPAKPADPKAAPPLAAPARPATPAASGAPVPPAPAPAGTPKASPKPPEPARPASVSKEPAPETEAARKERLRKATGL
jgi:serine/threonine-protein kinase